MGFSRHDHARSALKELHWLPVEYNIKFKLALMMYKIHTRQCSDYLAILYKRQQRSSAVSSPLSDSISYFVPRTRTKFGDTLFLLPGQSCKTVFLQQFVKQTLSLDSSFKRKMMLAFAL